MSAARVSHLAFLMPAQAACFAACLTIPGAMSVIRTVPLGYCFARDIPGSPAPLAMSIHLGLGTLTSVFVAYTHDMNIRSLPSVRQ